MVLGDVLPPQNAGSFQKQTNTPQDHGGPDVLASLGLLVPLTPWCRGLRLGVSESRSIMFAHNLGQLIDSLPKFWRFFNVPNLSHFTIRLYRPCHPRKGIANDGTITAIKRLIYGILLPTMRAPVKRSVLWWDSKVLMVNDHWSSKLEF